MPVLDLQALLGRVRGTSRPNYTEGDEKVPQMERGGELVVASGAPPGYAVTRLGLKWSAVIPTGSAFTYVNAWPTTRAEIVFRNVSTNKVAVFERAFCVDITSAAAAHSHALLAQLVAVHAAVTDDTAVLFNGRRNGETYTRSSVLEADLALTTMIANKWELIGQSINPNSASIGTGIVADMGGDWVVRPGGAIGFAAVGSTAAGTAIIGAVWSEYDL